ncbi:MAG: GNAT family N-acetyltransferase [Clostridia bacterium]|nr:GNAT family N-acetyltransferase [Clostridia bacterium]
MDHAEAVGLLEGIHPGFFDQPNIKRIPDQRVFEEMLLWLRDFDAADFPLPVPPEVTFGPYTGPREALLTAVAQVGEGWVPLFTPESRVYCGMYGDRIASFCLVEDMGVHQLAGRRVRVAGPGCVGTVPAFRRMGIGLRMVCDVTALLRQEGYDISYIHYTAVAPWYAKLGYRTCLRWTGSGPIRES